MISTAPVAVESGIIRVHLDGLVEVLYGPLVLAQAPVSEPPGVVGIVIIRVQLDGLV